MKPARLQTLLGSLGALCVLCGASFGQPPADTGPSPPKFPPREITEEQAVKEKARLEKEATAAFAKDDFAGAQAHLEQLIPLDHGNFVPWYNLACALSMQGKAEEGFKMLMQAMARGFADLRQLRADPHMANVRATADFKTVEKSWGTVVRKRAEMTIANAKKKFRVGEKGSPYATEHNERLRLVYISAFDPVLFKQAKEDAAKLERWWRTQVLPPSAAPAPAPTPPAPDAPTKTPENGAPSSSPPSSPSSVSLPSSASSPSPPLSDETPFVVVILPTREDYISWAMQRYGERYDRVGGEYNHDSKMLVSMDLGSSWRHEFWHVLHWRHMDDLGQRHPLWIMEGLCSLVEDCDAAKDGTMIPRASWRTNMVRRIARAGNLIPFEVFFDTGRKRFMNDRPLAQYGQARAMFLYLFERGKLREWYSAYTKNYAEDPTGRGAFESVLGEPIKEIERDFKVWCRNLPEVAEEVGRGPANLPFEVGIGSGDGPIVGIDALAEFSQPGAKPRNTSALRDKDVITAIDGKPVRDLNDLARVLGGYQAGAMVKVAYLRGKTHGEASVKLAPPEP